MAFTEDELAAHTRLMSAFIERRRPPEHIRPKLDFAFRITGQSIEIYTIRPKWDDPSRTMYSSIAKTTYVRTTNVWRVFWMMSDLKWHGYEPQPEVPSLLGFIKLVDEDMYSCFWG